MITQRTRLVKYIIPKKMVINRSRKWVINSEGYSQHVDG